MSRANPLRGAPRVHGELAKLGISIFQAAVSKYMVRHRPPPSHTWRSFLDNHAKDLVVWSKYSNAQRVSSLHLSKGCLNPASRSDTYSFRVRSSLPATRPAADLSQPCAPPVGLSPATRSPRVGSQLYLLFIHPRAPNLIGLRSPGTMPA